MRCLCINLALLVLIFFGALLSLSRESLADSASAKSNCPVIVDRESGSFSKSKAKYKCYKNEAQAKRAGYKKHSFSDDSSCTPTSILPPDAKVTGTYILVGPGEKESVVLLAPDGGTFEYFSPGDGEFEIKVLSANTGKRLESLLETTQAGNGSGAFIAQTVPITIKAEGLGSWQVGVTLNE